MNIKTCLMCESPKFVRNKYTQEWIQVPCGRCAGCVTTQNYQRTMVLDRHFASYPYCYFVTLTYNEQFVPKSESGLNIVSKRDVQLFIKRLRKLANYEAIFYFCASEYGPTSLRPHYHLLFGFDSSELAENFPSYVSQSWVTYVNGTPFSNGFIDIQSVVGGATQYVTNYIHSNSHLSDELREYPTFTLQSRFPQTGLRAVSYSQLYQLLYSPKPALDFPVIAKNDTTSLDVWKNLQDRFFFKCYKYSKLSPRDRFKVYTLSSWFGRKTFSDFYADFRGKSTSKFDSSVQRIRGIFGLDGIRQDTPEYEVEEFINRFRSAWYLSRKFVRNCSYFNISYQEYLHIIDSFYCRRELDNLHKQLQFEQEIVDQYGVDYLPFLALLIDPLFYENKRGLKYHDYVNIKDSWRFWSSSAFRKSTEKMFRSQSLVKAAFRARFESNVKTKKNNDYLLTHPIYRL